jgi:hypothetical protein
LGWITSAGEIGDGTFGAHFTNSNSYKRVALSLYADGII